MTGSDPVKITLIFGVPVMGSVDTMESSPSTITDDVLITTCALLGKTSCPMIRIPPVKVSVLLSVISIVTHLPQGMVSIPLDVYEAPMVENKAQGNCIWLLQPNGAKEAFTITSRSR